MKVGVMLELWENPALGTPITFADVRARALQAEETGFDSAWLIDHLGFRSSETRADGVWECWTFLSALAQATSRLELGTLVVCTQYRNPALLAKMAVTLDEVSGGRLILGVGAGWLKEEFDAFGYPWEHRVDRFEEAVEIIVPLLREGTVDFQGKYYRALNCAIVPRGPRSNGPPILIGAARPRMMRLAARYADCWSLNENLTEPSAAVGPRTAMEEACREVGRDPTTLPMTVKLWVGFPDLGPVDPHMGPYVTSVGAVVDALRAFEGLGIAHVMCGLFPCNSAGLARLAQALHIYHQTA